MLLQQLSPINFLPLLIDLFIAIAIASVIMFLVPKWYNKWRRSKSNKGA